MNYTPTISSLFHRTVESGQSGVTIARVIPRSRSAVCSLMLVDSFVEHLLLLFYLPSLLFRYPTCSSHFLRGSRMPLWNIYDFLGKLIGIIFHTLILSLAGYRSARPAKAERRMIFLPLLCATPGGAFRKFLRRWQTFVTFDEFSWEFFFFTRYRKRESLLHWLITLLFL